MLLVMKMLVTLKLMSIPIVPQIIAGKTNAQYPPFCGRRAKKRPEPMYPKQEMSMRIVPEMRCRMKPPTVEMSRPPNAMGTVHATICSGLACMMLCILRLR
jgi:hypothetical protein